jgi:hypothetical protein
MFIESSATAPRPDRWGSIMTDHDTRAVHPRRRNKISGQFSAHLIEMLESPAYRALSRSALMVISRIEIELAHHGGKTMAACQSPLISL